MFSTYKKKHIILNFTISLIYIKDTKKHRKQFKNLTPPKTLLEPNISENFIFRENWNI